MLDHLHIDILLPAFCAGLLILLTHVPLGIEVLRRGIIFIDLAIAQIAGLGVLIATQLQEDPDAWVIQLAAVVSALLGAALFNWIEKHDTNVEEALIGVTFILAATAGLIVLANDPHAGQQFKELLVGQILWVDWSSLIVPAIVTAVVIAIWLLVPARPSWLFYALFAIAITTSVQLIGVYLVFASLILPALSARRHRLQTSGRAAIVTGMLVGLTGYLVGLTASSLFDLPSGPMIVWSLAIAALAVFLFDKRLAKNT